MPERRPRRRGAFGSDCRGLLRGRCGAARRRARPPREARPAWIWIGHGLILSGARLLALAPGSDTNIRRRPSVGKPTTIVRRDLLRNVEPRVFAHRGGCALGPENTMATFERGLAAGADGLELDVHLPPTGSSSSATTRRSTDHRCIRSRQSSHRGRALSGRCRIPVGRYRPGNSFRSRMRASASRGFATCSADPGRPDHHRDEGRSPGDGAAVAAEVLPRAAVDRVCAASDGAAR